MLLTEAFFDLTVLLVVDLRVVHILDAHCVLLILEFRLGNYMPLGCGRLLSTERAVLFLE